MTTVGLLSPAENEREVIERIHAHKRRLGSDLVILGHHYQTDTVIQCADFTGDSLELARHAAATTARLIVFCGVHFMAESADILTRPDQTVVLPNADAGCPMADMASVDELESAWLQLGRIMSPDEQIMPVTYINSGAAVKAFCGLRGGLTCTSANARKILTWALTKRPVVFFFPDEHLGRNTALSLGIPHDQMLVWNPAQPFGGNTPDQLRKARVLLWQGHCHVHSRFRRVHVEQARLAHPQALVAVHPECRSEVAQAADATGSTGFLITYVDQAPPGSTIIVGTEINLVGRLARTRLDRTVLPLGQGLCPNMFKNTAADVLEVIEQEGRKNAIRVAAEIAEPARVALNRMLQAS
ncbi:MAG TPA: quinolinate synthase NadA [Candidatus Ozemobacteraceae bacterium]|nr:quinolinate synthase NadA [Candidatus Ozemobacteraceae bacterium]